MLRSIAFFFLLTVLGCSTSEVYRPASDKETPGVITEEQTAYVQSEGIKIEAKVARESSGRFRVDLVVDNGSGYNIDFSPGDIKLLYNGIDLKPYSTRFLRNWSYQSATRGTFAPSESAYATVSYNSPEGSAQGGVTIEVTIGGVADSKTGRQIEFPKIHFGPGVKETIPGAKPAPSSNLKTKS